MAKHPGDIRLVFKQFPLDTHSQAGVAAEAALAAHAQGKFWPMHDILYAHFREISPKNIFVRSEEHTSELQSQSNLVCRLLLEKKKKKKSTQNESKLK